MVLLRGFTLLVIAAMNTGTAGYAVEPPLKPLKILIFADVEGLALESARLIPSRQAWKLIERKTIEAIGRIGSIKPAQASHPVTIRKQMLNPINMDHWKGKPGVRIVDGRTTEQTADTVEGAFGF